MKTTHVKPIKSEVRDYYRRMRGELVQMGLPRVDLDTETACCEVCGGTAMVRYDVPVGHPQFGKMYACENPDCPHLAKIRYGQAEKITTFAGVPTTYKDITFRSFFDLPHDLQDGKLLAASSALSMAQNAANGYWYSLRDAAQPHRPTDYMNYDDTPLNWLVLWGPLGVGKTGLAASLVNWVTSRGNSATFYRAADMFLEIQRAYSNHDDQPDSGSILKSIQKTPLLVVDELNMNPSADKIRIIEEIMRHRDSAGLPTVITCNVNKTEFCDMWGERTFAVVNARAYWVPVGGRMLRHQTPDVVGF